MCTKSIKIYFSLWTMVAILLPSVNGLASVSIVASKPKSTAENYHKNHLLKPVILVVSQDCAQCDKLLEDIKAKCETRFAQKQLGILAFGTKSKIQQKLWAFKNLETKILEISHAKQLSAEVTPVLWVDDKGKWDVKTGVNQIQNYLWDKENDLCRS